VRQLELPAAVRRPFARRRQVWSDGSRAHVEHREVPLALRAGFEAAVREELDELLGVASVAFLIRPPRVVVGYDELWTTPDELEAAVERAERRAGLDDRTIPLDRPSHPADRGPTHRFAVELGLDAVAVVLAAAGRVTGWTPPLLEVDLARLATVVENTPELRRAIERQLGPHGTDLLLATSSAVLQGLARSVSGPIVDAVHRSLLSAEHRSRRASWQRWEPDVAAGAQPSGRSLAAVARPRRDPPEGSLERYAHRTLEASLAAFASGLVTTGDLGQAMAPVVDALPKAARLGREAFAAQLARELGDRGVLVMDRQALRRLDRVDTLVLDGRLLLATTASGRPVRPHRIARAGQDLLGAASATGLRVVVSGRSAAGLAEVDGVTTHAGLGRAIGRLQADEHSVLAAVLDPAAAVAGADVSVGVTRAEGPAPVGADLLVGPDLDAVCLLIEACAAARTHTDQTIRIAIAGTVLGAAAAIGRPGRDATVQAARAIDAASLAAIANGVRSARAVTRRHVPLRHAPPPWHTLAPSEVLQRLGSSPAGLAAVEAARRRPAVIREPGPTSRFVQAVAQELATPLTPVLAAGAGLSLATGSAVDASLVSLVLGVNAALGAAQRLQAGAAVAALDGQRDRQVEVRRPAGPERVRVDQLVPGDVLELLPGDVVPADLRLLAASGLEVDEASLTGESVSVRKRVGSDPPDAPVAERRAMLHEATTVVAGEAVAVVVATGDDTQAGRAALRSREAAPLTGVDRRLADLTDLTIPVAIAGSVGVLASGLVRRQPLADVVATAVSLAVAAVPEGLPLLASVAERGAARRLSGHGSVVRDARAVEALGRVDVLCIDKTGTLTEGLLRLTVVSDGAVSVDLGRLDAGHRRVLLAARRSTPIRTDGRVAHPTDGAVADATALAGIRREGTGGFDQLAALPFEPSRGYHAVLARTHRGRVVTVKGAPEVVLDRCRTWTRSGTRATLTARRRAAVTAHAEELARQGLRVLAVAERPAPSSSRRLTDDDVAGLDLLGFVGLRDPVRATARSGDRRAAGRRAAGRDGHR
jgi:cation-transporting P-type ATPase I